MDRILFLCHRIPYPPNKGDKIRSFHILKHLAQRYRVALGAFVDDPDDLRHRPVLEEYCESLHLVPIQPWRQRARSLTALLGRGAMSVRYYRDRGMRRWADAILDSDDLAGILAYSSPVAQYAMSARAARVPRVADLVDLDSEKWRQYAERSRGVRRLLLRTEAARLLAYECRIASEFDETLFVSPPEANLFRERAPGMSARVRSIPNGVDVEYFDPGRDYPSCREGTDPYLVFTGAMDYRANVDAAQWFVHEILPAVRAAVPSAQLYIVGARPSRAVRLLGREPGVVVTGTVEDIRPYLAAAAAAVAPLRVARGVQNKVLEAMAMGKPVLATPAAMEGIGAEGALCRYVSAEPSELIAHAISLLTGPDSSGTGELGRSFVVRRFAWEQALSGLTERFETSVAAGRRNPDPPAPSWTGSASHEVAS